MCGILGIVGRSPVAGQLYDGLTVLQHRGQDAAGIATGDGVKLHVVKDMGLVRDVFNKESMETLAGNAGIGHVRYPTAGRESADEAQPLYVNSPYGIVLGHNGNLVNTEQLKTELFLQDRRHLNTESDSEILLNVLAHELQIQDRHRLDPDHVFKAVAGVHERCNGAYAATALIHEYGLLAFRDPLGIRPVCFGYRDTPRGREWAVASESVALQVLGFELERDVAPGEAVFITLDGQVHTRRCANVKPAAPCIFEYVYLARPDSMMENISVYKARLRMGDMLAEKILRQRPDHDIDVVIPIPDTSRTAALPLSYQLGVKYREGFIKNRYIGRTFIMPGQQERKKNVRRKLNPIPLEFKNKNVLLVDDSIVRGTTSTQIVQMAREAGAKRVYLASAAPPVRYPNVYGIDMPTADELIAHNRSVEEIQAEIGCDWLIYQDLEDLVESCKSRKSDVGRFDTSCFSGQYLTGVSPDYLEALQLERSDSAKADRRLAVAAG